jgi:alpha-galactosidase
MKIAFIGGGSVQWTPKLVTDMILTDKLAGADLILYDINPRNLELLTQASRRIVEQLQSNLSVASTTDRIEALREADFVILCIGVGGLAAMSHDLEIPERYGIYQAVGDTVGPGGLARGLRHIPVAVAIAREMEQVCPRAWLLNLTNPMTTICRAVTRATTIRTIGLCHEVGGVRCHLAKLFEVPVETVTFDVAGINHLPLILNCRIGTRDGLAMLRDWLADYGPFTFINQHDPDPVRDVFRDRLAVKFSLFEQLGILFGAGDRHVAEFFAGFLTETSEYGRAFGVELTKIHHRKEQTEQRRAQIEQFVKGAPAELQKSDEQLTGVMAALAGGPANQFVVNIPNEGQIDNLPRQAVVECIAEVGPLGVRPVATGPLPYPAYAAVAPHVARQELIVEAALTRRQEPALAALTTDPLIRDAASVKPMLAALLAAQAEFMERMS